MNAHLLGQQQQKPQAFGVSVNDGPLASPLVIPQLLGTPEGAQVVMSFGGLTKVEYVATEILAAFLARVDTDSTAEQINTITAAAVSMARLLLAECQKSQAEEDAATQARLKQKDEANAKKPSFQ